MFRVYVQWLSVGFTYKTVYNIQLEILINDLEKVITLSSIHK